MQGVIWFVRATVAELGVGPGDVVSSHESGEMVHWRPDGGDWLPRPTAGITANRVAGWWRAGVIVPASQQDEDRFLVHQLLRATDA